jgi:hypothetical protein
MHVCIETLPPSPNDAIGPCTRKTVFMARNNRHEVILFTFPSVCPRLFAGWTARNIRAPNHITTTIPNLSFSTWSHNYRIAKKQHVVIINASCRECLHVWLFKRRRKPATVMQAIVTRVRILFRLWYRPSKKPSVM